MKTKSHNKDNLVDDAKITLEVNAKLAMEPGIPVNKINVKTIDAEVILTGMLDSQEQANTAIHVVSMIPEVKKINTEQLKVVGASEQPLTDFYITAKIKALFLKEKLFDNHAIPAFSLNVETKNGVVYLSGTVDNVNIENTAITLAKTISGVSNVVSYIIAQDQVD